MVVVDRNLLEGCIIVPPSRRLPRRWFWACALSWSGLLPDAWVPRSWRISSVPAPRPPLARRQDRKHRHSTPRSPLLAGCGDQECAAPAGEGAWAPWVACWNACRYRQCVPLQSLQTATIDSTIINDIPEEWHSMSYVPCILQSTWSTKVTAYPYSWITRRGGRYDTKHSACTL